MSYSHYQSFPAYDISTAGSLGNFDGLGTWSNAGYDSSYYFNSEGHCPSQQLSVLEAESSFSPIDTIRIPSRSSIAAVPTPLRQAFAAGSYAPTQEVGVAPAEVMPEEPYYSFDYEKAMYDAEQMFSNHPGGLDSEPMYSIPPVDLHGEETFKNPLNQLFDTDSTVLGSGLGLNNIGDFHSSSSSESSDSLDNSGTDWDGDTECSPVSNKSVNLPATPATPSVAHDNDMFYTPSESVKVRTRNNRYATATPYASSPESSTGGKAIRRPACAARSATPYDSLSDSSVGRRKPYMRLSPRKKQRRRVDDDDNDDDDYTFERASSSTPRSRGSRASSSPAKRRFPCTICPQVCFSAGDLNRHMQREDHNPTNDNICDRCQKCFTRKDALVRHIRNTCNRKARRAA